MFLTDHRGFFWTCVSLIAFTALVFVSSLLLLGEVPILLAGLLIGAAIIGGWLYWRGLIRRSAIPRTGLEIPLLAFYGGLLLSLFLSRAPRLGVERSAWIFFYGLLLYGLMDLMEKPKARAVLRNAILWGSGLVVFGALLETDVWYTNWWALVGSHSIYPPFPYRFISITGHSNVLMALANLCAPLALVAFLTSRKRIGRIGAAFWLVTYLFAVPFSSSRGGWLGAAVWIGVIASMRLVEGSTWKPLLKTLRKRWPVTLAVGTFALLISLFVAIKFYLFFAARNPTHAAGVDLNRSLMWTNAIQVWRASPWFGVGPGRVGVEFLASTQSFPARWWPWNAHSVPLQILAETGLAGFLPFAALVGLAAWRMTRAYRATPLEDRPWGRACLAALASITVQSFFDDFTQIPLIIALVLFNMASILCAASAPRRFLKLPLSGLGVPAAALAAVAAFSIWSYAPLYYGRDVFASGRLAQAAAYAEESMRRDPAMPIYHAQAGLAWAKVWKDTGDPQYLQRARSRINESLQLESNNSLLWADMAVLDWQAGERDIAMVQMQRAIQLRPVEPSFPLMMGWFSEQMGQKTDALTEYHQVLWLAPRTITHPFWDGTTVRRDASLALTQVPQTGGPFPFWEQARTSLAAGNLVDARYALALSQLYGEPPAATSTGWAELAKRDSSSRANLNAVVKELDHNYWDFAGMMTGYNSYFGREGFPLAVVPGYMMLSEDAGQFAVLESLHNLQVKAGDCLAAAHTWEVYQRELHAGAPLKDGYPPPPACP